MDNIPDSALINSPNINSVLKPPKPQNRIPLKDLVTAVPEEDNTASRKRRVSFANVNKIKEFSAGAESMVVCQTPAYEEPFSVSSDSSYPSGVDGWTPAKGQSSIHGNPPIHPEKENVSIPSLVMSTGMDLTSLVGNSVQNTRYSVNGMDLTELANSHETYLGQQSRYSVGMNLTNVVGHPSQNTRYSVSGMDLTHMDPQSLVDHRTRFSMGMDLTNVIGHSAHSTRYSMNRMDLTEAANPHQSLFDQRSARFSVGMDMTNVGNSMKTVRYSCNEMDLTEAVNPNCYENQSCEGGLYVNRSMDDSDALELTEAVGCPQFSAVSPNYKINDVGLTENVLYSVNKTRFSVNSMDMTRAASSRVPSARRKSSRYSLVNMDLTEVINNSCDDLEFTKAIVEPIINAGSTRNSMCEMDLTEPIVVGVTRLSSDNMDQTSIVGDRLGYSADTEASMNVTRSNNSDPPIYDKENILPNHSLDIVNAPKPLSQDDQIGVDSKLSIINVCTDADEPLPQVTPQYPIMKENEPSDLQNTIPLNNSLNIKQIKCEQLLNEVPCNIESSHKVEVALKENSSSVVANVSKVTNNDSKGIIEHEGFSVTQNNDCVSFPSLKNESSVAEEVETTNFEDKETSCIQIETTGVIESSIGHLVNNSKTYKTENENKTILNSSNCNNTHLEHVDAAIKTLDLHSINSAEELKLDKPRLSVDHFEYNCSKNDGPAGHHGSCTVCKEKSTLQNESKNVSEHLKGDTMDVSITDNIGSEEPKANDEPNLPEIKNPENTLKYFEEVSSLNESVMNMSIENCPLIEEVEDVENVSEQKIVNDFTTEENRQQTHEHITRKDQSIELNISSNVSLNLSSRSVLCSKNITMTRGRSKSFITTPETSLETSNRELSCVENEEMISMQSASVAMKTPVKEDDDYQSENNFKQSAVNHQKRGKRSFEAALEAENDTEESPIKQLCLSRDEPSTEYEILSNVTAPSFLMDTVAASNETLPCLDQPEMAVLVKDVRKSKPTSPSESSVKNTSFDTTLKKMSETKQDFSLRMDDSLIRNMSENPLRHDVIDLCESSFEATTTEVRDLINNSRYKIRNAGDVNEVLNKQKESFSCTMEKLSTSGLNDISFDHRLLDQIPQPWVIKENCRDDSLNMAEAIGTKVWEREVEKTDPLQSDFKTTQLSSRSRRTREKVRTLTNNSYAADFIPNLIEIHFSIDPYGNLNHVDYESICTGDNSVIGEYLVKQARNYVLPEKGSDLILKLKSTNKSFLARLARNITMICKYLNGSVKGDILTLEVASCRGHFWTFIDVNIKHPQYLNQTDITISKQMIGELKLSHVRKLFNSIENNQDQLLNFAKAITKLQ